MTGALTIIKCISYKIFYLFDIFSSGYSGAHTRSLAEILNYSKILPTVIVLYNQLKHTKRTLVNDALLAI